MLLVTTERIAGREIEPGPQEVFLKTSVVYNTIFYIILQGKVSLYLR